MSLPLSPMVTRNAVQALAESALPGAPLIAESRRRRSIRTAFARGRRAVTAEVTRTRS